MSSRPKERSSAPHSVKANKLLPFDTIRNSVFVNLTTLNERYWVGADRAGKKAPKISMQAKAKVKTKYEWVTDYWNVGGNE